MLNGRYPHAIFFKYRGHTRVTNAAGVGGQLNHWIDIHTTKYDAVIHPCRAQGEGHARTAVQTNACGRHGFANSALLNHAGSSSRDCNVN